MTNPIFSRIEEDIKKSDVVLYMKGNAMFPQCGFSATVVEILNHFKIDFESFDVLQDPALREGIKEYSDWPTVPQLYVKGDFVGGCDIIREMAANGELVTHFEQNGVQPKA